MDGFRARRGYSPEVLLRAWVAALATGGLAGCTPEKADTGETSAGSSGTTEVDSATDSAPTDSAPKVCEPPLETSSDCCCFAVDLNFPGDVQNICPTVKLCPEVGIQCEGEGCPVLQFPGPEFEVDDTTALTCVLEALRDGQAGEVSWTFCNKPTGCQYLLTETYFIQEDRRVFVVRDSREDSYHEIKDITEETLEDPEHFAGCLQATGIELAACLHASTTGAVQQVCAPGGIVPPEGP
jgi:hypothetical protein